MTHRLLNVAAAVYIVDTGLRWTALEPACTVWILAPPEMGRVDRHCYPWFCGDVGDPVFNNPADMRGHSDRLSVTADHNLVENQTMPTLAETRDAVLHELELDGSMDDDGMISPETIISDLQKAARLLGFKTGTFTTREVAFAIRLRTLERYLESFFFRAR